MFKNSKRICAALLLLCLLLPAAASGLRAGDAPADDTLSPAIPASEAYDFQDDEDDEEHARAATATAAGDRDAPLEPEPGKAGRRGFRYGTILEYWFLEPGVRFTRMPPEPSLTGMIDDSKLLFSGNAMLRDGELKNYVARQGALQWTCYFRVTRAGKHVFAVSARDIPLGDSNFAGVALAFNDGTRAVATADKDTSVAVDFSAPGWYKMQVRIWWCAAEKPNFADYGAVVKVREPGSLSLRPIARKEIYYKQP